MRIIAYVTVPKDLTKIKSKMLFGLTKRQLVCFGSAALVGVPLFFLSKESMGTTSAALCMVFVRDTGDTFHEYYDGDRSSIPDEYRVMTFQDDLPEEEKTEWAMDIAFDMDEFFRQHDPQYAADHPEAHPAKEEIYEKLMAGRISALEEKKGFLSF